jgi:methionyl-tRNA formyltransferase
VRTVFLGTSDFAAAVLERLAAGPHRPALVITRPDAPRGRGRRLAAPPVAGTARELGIELLQPERLHDEDVLARIAAVESDVLCVCAYGALIREPLLSDYELINVHPSLLPRWRGAAPVERALLAGDAETGVTIHETVKELDAGPIAAQAAFLVEEDDDAGEVYARAAALAADLLEDVLGEEKPAFRPQPEEGVTYAGKIEPADRMLDLEKPARELVDTVRALSPHIGARAELEGRSVTVWRARVGENGGFEPLEVQPDGGRRMDYDAWLRGLR